MPDLPLERLKACLILDGTQFINTDTASSDDVGQAKAPFGKPPIFFVRERLIDQAGIEEELPKTVRGACKVVPHGGRSEPWINADKHDTSAWL